MPASPALSPSPPQAMDGTVDLTQSLEERLNLINCSPADIRRFIAAHPPASRVVPVSWIRLLCSLRNPFAVRGIGV